MENQNLQEKKEPKKYVLMPYDSCITICLMATVCFITFVAETIDQWNNQGIESYYRFAMRIISIIGLGYALCVFIIALFFRKKYRKE